MAAYLAVALLVLSVIAETESSINRTLRSSAHPEPIRRRGGLSQRGRKKTIWSYNPGHRSLAFLVAGDVEVVSPPPVESVTGEEYRCLGCCGQRVLVGTKTTSRPEPSNRVGRLVLRPDGLAVIGTEPNSVNGRCLGCCEGGTTPINRGTTTTITYTSTAAITATAAAITTAAPATARTRRPMRIPVTGRQRPWQAQRSPPIKKTCIPPKCNPKWRYESSSSSEEVSVVRRPPPQHTRMQPIRSRVDRRCRHLGCRSPLGSIGDDSSSSEED